MSKNNISILPQDLTYDRHFETDQINFLNGDFFKVIGINKEWTIFTNFHGTVELNITPNSIPGARTLSWATPFEYSRYLFSTLSDSHDYSALLLDWSTKVGVDPKEHHHYRDQVTFLLIPPQKEMTFLIGFASPQVPKEKRDERKGGGVQLRFKNIPAGSLTIQVPLQLEKSKTMQGGKESKIYDFEKTYENAMNDLESYMDELSPTTGNVVSIPQSLFMKPPKIYSTIAENLDIQNLEKNEISYLQEILKKFDISKYVFDHWSISHMEEISVAAHV